MTVPNLTPINGLWNDVTPATAFSPYSGSWWSNSYIERIPETAVGFLAAAGWSVISTYTEDDVTYYNMGKQAMQNWKILQTMLEAYTFSFNEGRRANDIRYEDLLFNWNAMLVASRGTLDTTGDVSDLHVSLYLTQIDTLLADLETDVGVLKTELDAIKTDIDAQLALYLSKINAIEADYTTHQNVVRALLVDLGATETARINEQFDNALAKTKQSLVTRGLYSSVLYAQLEARVERERAEALITLNDRLAREKNDNEHKLFAEHMSTHEMILSGRVHYISQCMQKTGLADAKQRLVFGLMGARMEKANARMGVRDREEKLMLAQLDVRNRIAFALHATVENRVDDYPNLESAFKLIAGVADSGGGWITP